MPYSHGVECSSPSLQLNIAAAVQKVEQWFKAATLLSPTLPKEDPVLLAWIGTLKEFLGNLRVLQKLTSPAIKVGGTVGGAWNVGGEGVDPRMYPCHNVATGRYSDPEAACTGLCLLTCGPPRPLSPTAPTLALHLCCHGSAL